MNHFKTNKTLPLKTIQISFCLLALILLTAACTENYWGEPERRDFLSVEEYAANLIDNMLEITEDLKEKNSHILESPHRFTHEIEALETVSTVADMEDLIENTDIRLDINLLKRNLSVIDDITEALDEQIFTPEALSKQISWYWQSMNPEPWSYETIQLRRDRMDCLKEYDKEVLELEILFIGCLGTSALTILTIPVTSRTCAIGFLAGILLENINFYNCVNEF